MKVVSLRHEPIPEVVSVLEGLLDGARRGDVTAVAVAAVSRADGAYTIVADRGGDDWLRLLGASIILTRELSEGDGDDEE